ncbi:MAG: acylphosphatase [Alphaproteobacteria bacterium]|nr:acylphosphatase [Alphaproteobacteria bacterium]
MSLHIRVYGRVQGVGYRAWTVYQALDLQLTGFVRNRRDRSVEIFAEGDEKSLNMLLERCYSGPTFSRVDKIEVVSHPDAPMPQMLDTFTSSQTV